MKTKRKILWLFVVALFSGCFMFILYVTSEKQMHHENPFQRRFINGSAELVKQRELHTSTLYFAGTDGSKIYVGDSQAPLHIFVIDTLLQTQKQFRIKLENEDFPFKRVQVKVSGPSFYLLDGTVPIIFKGSVADWDAKILMHEQDAFFTHAEILDNNHLVFRTYLPKESETVLGKFEVENGLAKIKYSPELLQKQMDGLFDVDGIMQVDRITKKLVYLYYYRNQFSVIDPTLKLLHRGNTIDTNTTANLKVSFNETTGKRQLASPAFTVNRLMSVQDEFMFVNSNVPGRYENKSMWEVAGIVDVYDLSNDTYLSSFYVHNILDSKLRDMLIINSSLFVLVGNQINRYQLGKQFNRKSKQG